jgi:hypothetical protein
MSAFDVSADIVPRTKKPKVQIGRTKTSLDWAFRIDIGAGLTQAPAREGAKRTLAIYERKRARPAIRPPS